MSSSKKTRNFLRTGAISGMASSFIFLIIHHIFISNIWFSWLVMILSGLICGMCVSWSYVLLFDPLSIRNWIKYNSLYVLMFMLLGVTSVIIFDPITTVAALIAANEPPIELIREATPMTVIFTLVMAILINQLYGGKCKLFGSILLTCIILFLLLGLNVSAIGLVSIPGNSIYLIFELLGLILAINVFYVGIFILFERRGLSDPNIYFN